MTDQKIITLTLSEFHWLRIRGALLREAERLTQEDPTQAAQYRHSHELVKLGLEPWLTNS